MKLKFFSLFIVLFSFYSIKGYSQELAHKDMDTELSEDQRTEVAGSDKWIQKAKGFEKKADDIEKECSKYKNKSKKYEKKTWEAKESRITAEDNYMKAYQQVIDVYTKFIEEASFYLDSDKDEAIALNEEVKVMMDDASKTMSKYKKFEKGDLKKEKLKKVQSSMTAIHEQLTGSLEKEFKALNIYLAQADKKKNDMEDELAWTEASDLNKKSSYYEYLNNFPGGKHVSEANKRIREFERKEEEARKKAVEPEIATSNTNGWVFQVQVLASRVRLNESQIAAKAPGVTKYDEAKNAGWFKYRTGTFYSYRDASKYRDTLTQVPEAFIVVFDSNTGKQLKVTDEMKK